MEVSISLLSWAGANGDIALAINNGLSAGALALTHEEAWQLAKRRSELLEAMERVEFGTPVIIDIAETMATSPYLVRESLADVLSTLQETYYELRSDLEANVPDVEIFDALRSCFDACGGDADELASMSASEIMPFSEDYLQALEHDHVEARLIDDEGRIYVLDASQWDYDERSNGWDGEGWDDDWDD